MNEINKLKARFLSTAGVSAVQAIYRKIRQGYNARKRNAKNSIVCLIIMLAYESLKKLTSENL